MRRQLAKSRSPILWRYLDVLMDAGRDRGSDHSQDRNVINTGEKKPNHQDRS